MDFGGAITLVYAIGNDLAENVVAAGGENGKSLVAWQGEATPDPGGLRNVARTATDLDVVGSVEAPALRPAALSVLGSPGRGPFAIQWSGETAPRTLRGYDTLGRLVLSPHLEGSASWLWHGEGLSGQRLPAGTYFLELTSGLERVHRARVTVVR
jgi:hypothetical protein